MSTELIKLKIKKQSSTGDNAQKIIDKFIEACLTLDCSILEPMIDEDLYFEDIDKYRFLASLREQFDWAINRGAKDMYLKRGICQLCSKGSPVLEFHGSNNKLEFAYIINTKKDEVTNIFLCNLSSGRK
jgi:hypothetical protein